MVAFSCCACPAADFITPDYWGRFSTFAFCIHLILMEKDKKYAYLETIVALMLGSIFFSLVVHWQYLLWFAIAIGLIGLLTPVLASGIHKGWLFLGKIMGKVSSTVLLAVIFYLLLVPLSFLKRLFGKPETLREKGNDGNFILRNHTFTKQDFDDLW
jgi:hypothetical protein